MQRTRAAKIADQVLRPPSKRICFLYVAVASLIAVNTVLFGKAFGEILLPSLAGNNKFTDPFAALIVLVFLISLPCQLVMINLSLSVNDVLMHTPNFYVLWNLGSMITGAVFYEEMNQFGLINWIIFPLGAAVLFFGVFLVNVALAQKTRMAVEEMAELERKRIWEMHPDNWKSGMTEYNTYEDAHDFEQW